MAAPPALRGAIEQVWDAAQALPDDERSFSRLDPAERRALHGLGLRAQDRLVRALSRLVVDMAADGADLLDERGVPLDYRAEAQPPEESVQAKE